MASDSPLRSDVALASIAPRSPSLDGLRAVAVVMVVVCHYVPEDFGPIPVQKLVSRGGFGVDIFFVLSGFIITRLLLCEESRNGCISLPFFYARRAVRIIPPLVLYLVTLAVLTAIGISHVSISDIGYSLFFVRNLFGSSGVTGHFWTLAIEEQFYLIWPFFMAFVARPRVRLALAATVVIISPFWRHIAALLAGGSAHLNHVRTDLRLDGLFMGALLAMIDHRPQSYSKLHNRFLMHPLAALLPLAVILLDQTTDIWSVPVVRLFRPSLLVLAVAMFINILILCPDSAAARILAMGPCVWLGRISYSLYVWQQLFAPKITGSEPMFFREFPINLIGAISCSLISYYVVEQPLFALRSRLKPRQRCESTP